MKAKIICILLMTLLFGSLFCCIFGGAARINNNKISLINNSNEVSPSNLEEIILEPPWPIYYGEKDSWWEASGNGECLYSADEYSAWFHMESNIVGAGSWGNYVLIYHEPYETIEDSFIASRTDDYDFKFYYSYNGCTQHLIHATLPESAGVNDNIYLNFIVSIHNKDLNSYQRLNKKITIEEGHWTHDKEMESFDEDIKVEFNDIHILQGSHVSFRVEFYAWQVGFVMLGSVASVIEFEGWLTKVVIFDPNNTPIRPTIEGPREGKPGNSYIYSFTSSDPNGDDIEYYVDWGDGYNTNWIGPYASGDTALRDHSWDGSETYQIKAKTRDIYGKESDWSYYDVIIPRDKAFNIPILNYLQTYPYLFPILQKLIQQHWFGL